MRKTLLVTSMACTWVLAIAFEQIELATGTRIDVLLFAAVASMVFGLCAGLCAKNKRIKKEEA